MKPTATALKGNLTFNQLIHKRFLLSQLNARGQPDVFNLCTALPRRSVGVSLGWAPSCIGASSETRFQVEKQVYCSFRLNFWDGKPGGAFKPGSSLHRLTEHSRQGWVARRASAGHEEVLGNAQDDVPRAYLTRGHHASPSLRHLRGPAPREIKAAERYIRELYIHPRERCSGAS